METNNFTMKDMLLGFAQVINETKGNLPLGCISFNDKTGVYNAKSISDVANFKDEVIAIDGFIYDGLMVKKTAQRRSEPSEKFNGYKTTFELSGTYNGPVTIFCKTENEYKIYLHKDMWKINSREITYKALDEDNEDFVRSYMEPMTLDKLTGEFRVMDNRASVENKVGYAMKVKFNRDYEAFDGDLRFNEHKHRFEAVDLDEDNTEIAE